MVRPKEFDERIALAAAMQVFWEKGYEAASLSDLTQRMNIQRPSLYATFGGKRELFEAALKAYVQSSLTYIENQLRSDPSVKKSMLAYFQGVIHGAGGSNPDFGCLCVNTMVELAPHDPVFADITGDFQARLTELFQRTIDHGIQSGELPKQLNASSIARVLTLSAIGLSVTMKTKPDPARVEHAAAEILTLLE
ncbi:TetR/AcrR family transcriptional regulator [Paenibacillus methanolicus]|uniref:TetR/AcrR family transcriptional repressor of nem operon n=1 Tax=Paenibacillus methanolicus TaxID=582686 RepID=A0A5S5C6U8_9BACL|nr:TetR/AcrR family transcriptional regulator [Paenibacillus methanolicus]TYP74116.1 TetR/AcrR family transcriptional repressor of nem operon [Paenibacillus methanolicus]